jgi:DNA polymerase III epsilon subunit-like protein
MHWSDATIHFIDFEGNRVSGILEFGVVTIRGGQLVETRTRRCAATGRVGPEDTEIHGLRSEDVAGEPRFDTEWEYFAKLREGGPLGAHFAQAENSLLKSVWPYPRTSPDYARPGRKSAEWGPWIDTGRLYPQVLEGVEETRLERLIAAMGLQERLDAAAAKFCPSDRRRYHAALYDALGGALLLQGLLAHPRLADATVPWLLHMSTADGGKRSAMQQGDLF